MSPLQRIGKYQIVRELGKGAMGTVYEGFDPGIERKVAIKTILAEHLMVGSGESAVVRFRREAQAGGRLQHPGIVGIYEYGEENDLTFIVMEYVEGQELLRLMRAKGKFGLAEVMIIMRQLLEALDYSHSRGVVHRDIKPANVMVLDGLQIKVMDFGIARIQSSSLTQVGTVLGTPTHMAPEQLMGQSADGRADLWSAGVLLYELLTGHNPFAADTPAAVMHRVMQIEPAPLLGQVAGVPVGLDAVISCALAKDPANRFQSASEFLQALTMAAQGAPIDAPTPATSDIELTLSSAPTVSLERTIVSEPASAAPAPTLQLSALTLAVVESALEQSLGPLAKHLVRSCVHHVGNVADFYSTLASYIPDPAECDEFLKTVSRFEGAGPTRAAASGTQPGDTLPQRTAAFDADTLARAERHLTTHVGPLAKVLISRAVNDSGNVAELYRKLAEHIHSEPERSVFLAGLR